MCTEASTRITFCLLCASLWYSLLFMLIKVIGFLLLNMYLHVAWCLQSIINNGTVSEASLSSLLSKRTALFEHIEYYLQTSPAIEGAGKCGNQLACRVRILWIHL